MKYFQVYIITFLFSFVSVTNDSTTLAVNNSREVTNSFELIFNRVGLGPNMYDLQPAFRVRNDSFCFTSEEAWIIDKNVKQVVDTLYSGFFRTTSEDSINSILLSQKTNKISLRNLRFTDGAIDYLEIVTKNGKYSFEMDNTSDTTAEKIINILNSYIPDATLKIRLMK